MSITINYSYLSHTAMISLLTNGVDMGMKLPDEAKILVVPKLSLKKALNRI